MLPRDELANLDDAARSYGAMGVPAPLARQVAALRRMDSALDLADLAQRAEGDDHRSERGAQALAAGSVQAWLTGRRGPARRMLAVIDDIRSAGVADVTILSVALREARSLTRGC